MNWQELVIGTFILFLFCPIYQLIHDNLTKNVTSIIKKSNIENENTIHPSKKQARKGSYSYGLPHFSQAL